MLPVIDLQQSIAFYTNVLGVKLLRKRDYPAGRLTLFCCGFAEEKAGAVIELTHNWHTASYNYGNAFGYIATIQVGDVYHACQK